MGGFLISEKELRKKLEEIINKDELDKMIKEYVNEYDGFLSEHGALLLIAQDKKITYHK